MARQPMKPSVTGKMPMPAGMPMKEKGMAGEKKMPMPMKGKKGMAA